MKELKMPSLSPTMERGKIVKWIKREGEEIRRGDVIAEIETDKAAMEYESEDEGRLGKIIRGEGEEVAVGETIGVLLGAGEELGEIKVSRTETVAQEQQPSTEVRAEVAPLQSTPPASSMNYEGTNQDNYLSNILFHKINEFNQEVGSISNYTGPYKEVTVREALNEALREEMLRDQSVFIMGEEVAEYQGAYKVTQGLLQEFGADRVIDTPITEYGFAGIGVGAAYAGLKPVVEFMTFNFSMQASDHIINSAAKMYYMSNGQINCPIVFRGPNGAASRVAAQHSQCFGAWYSHIPGLIVIAPYSSEDAKGLLKAAIRNPNPVVFLENEILYGRKFPMPDTEEDFILPIGKAKIEIPGDMVTIVSYSRGLDYALGAAQVLAEQNISAEVINLRTLKPLDIDTITQSVKKTNRLVIVEEGWSYAGIGAEVSMQIIEQAFDYLDAPPIRVSGKDVPMPYAANLEKLALPSVEEVVTAVRKLI